MTVQCHMYGKAVTSEAKWFLVSKKRRWRKIKIRVILLKFRNCCSWSVFLGEAKKSEISCNFWMPPKTAWPSGLNPGWPDPNYLGWIRGVGVWESQMALPKEIFLSYGREAEVVEFVKKLKSDLEADGFGVWLDQNDIPAGCDWHAAIGSGLDQCHALLAVVTPKYVTSRYCTSELYTADGDQKIIFPVFYAETDLSSSERARGVKYVISGINWTMFRPNVDDYDISLEKLKFGLRQRGELTSALLTVH